MYEYEVAPTMGDRRKGMGKCEERKAIEKLPLGMMVRIPKDSAPEASVRNWASIIGKERMIRISVVNDGADWQVVARMTAFDPDKRD